MVQQFGTRYMMAEGTGTNYEVLRRHSYEIQIESIDSVLSAQSVTTSQYGLDQVEIFHFNTRTKIAARPNPSNLRVVLLDVVQPQVVQELWTWFKEIYDPNTDQMSYASSYKRQGKIFLYDVEGNLIRTWTCSGLWPMHSPTPSEDLDYESGNPVRIALELSCDNATLDASAGAVGGGSAGGV